MRLVKCNDGNFAFNRWIEVTGDEVEPNFRANFLGLKEPFSRHYPYDSNAEGWFLPDEAARKIEMLNGPHWRTIIRAYQAKFDGGSSAT